MGEVLEELFIQSECVIINNGQGTRIYSPTEDSPLDLTFIDKKFAHLATWVVHDDEWGSDHYPIFTHLGISPIHEETRVQHWNLAKAKWGRFTHLCTENISNIDDVDIDKFHDSIISCIKKSASLSIPLTSNKNGRDPLPFWNKQCQNVCNQKSASNKKYKSTKQLTDFIIFKKQKAFCQRIIKSSRRQYWRNYCSKLTRTSNLSSVWKMLKRMSGKSVSNRIPNIQVGNTKYATNKDKANILASQFAKVSSEENSSREFLGIKTKYEQENETSIKYNNSNNSILNKKKSLNDLKEAIKFAKKSSPGEDKISYAMYKHLSRTSLDKIVQLFNLIWSKGRLPSSWKHAVITPIPKIGKDPKHPSSYRPIALTSTLCKIMERIIVNRLN